MLALSAAVFPLFRLWTNSFESILYFRDEVKAVDQVGGMTKFRLLERISPGVGARRGAPCPYDV